MNKLSTTNNTFQEITEDNFLMISNSFDTIRLWSDLKVNEVNLLTAIMLEIAKQTGSVYEPIKEDKELSVNLKDLAIKSGVPSFKRSNAATKSAINKIHRTLMLANLTYTEGCEEVSNSFFTEIRTNSESGLLTVYLNARMVNSYLKISQEEGFTLLNVFQFLELKSKYSKGMFYLLSQWSSKGFVNLSLEGWKEKLYVPKSTNNQDLFRKYIQPALNELEQKGLFEIINVNKISKAGSRAITSCHITFKKLAKEASHAAQSAPRESIQPTIQEEQPKEPQKASDSTPYAWDPFGVETLTKAEFDELDKDLQKQCELLEGA
ncbi:replication initiation protein [Enterococcus casseliflavus]|uniref:replication initiation protein n=1 Tax=Enterococcus casseliflavus TaxID=37734 RepID=UPI002890A640|nr:replication initiation protein [Enterococcus casseliflavus]MDT2987785.1 replication initiation protein [Enterococcus casseliflavus]